MVTRILIILLALAVSASAQRICPPNQVNSNGLVGRWLVPGKQTGSVAQPTLCLDGSAKGNHGTTVNSPNYGVIYSRPAMTFNGISQYVTIPSNMVTAFPVSISYWFKTDFSANPIGVHFIEHWGNGSHVMAGGINQTGSYGYITSTTGIHSAISNFTNNAWNHVALVYTSDSAGTIYVNGTNVTTAGSNYWGPSGTEISTLGVRNNGGNLSWQFNGSLDDVRIYNRALTAGEIRAIYRGQQ